MKLPAARAWLLGLALLTALPFLPGLLAGGTFYYRDLAGSALPGRLYLLEGLAQGELRYWNPYLHEGEPSWPLPLSYPLELLQLLAPSPWGISLTWALHVPLAAVSFFLLARALKRPPLAAALGAVVYAWGGFTLSTLNLYPYVHSAAWAPLVVWACLKAADSAGARLLAPVGVAALGVSTLGVEMVAQAFLIGALLARPREWRPALAVVLCGALAVGLCGYVLLPLLGELPGSYRAADFGGRSGYALHPAVLLQTLFANLFGDLQDPTNALWNQRFNVGQAYILSFYLGAGVLGLALVGLRTAGGRWLGAVCLLGVLVALGGHLRPAGSGLPSLPSLPLLRSPVKAFFSVQLAAALLAAGGAEALAREAGRAWRTALRAWLLLGGAGVAAGVALLASPGARAALQPFLLDASVSAQAGEHVARSVASDALQGGGLALAAALVAAAALARRVAPGVALAAVGALVAADLLRAGAGLNPMVAPERVLASPESRQLALRLRQAGARVFPCYQDWQRTLLEAPVTYEDRLSALADVLTIGLDAQERVPTALSPNFTGLAPTAYAPLGQGRACDGLPSWDEALRETGITHVLAPNAIATAGLRLEETVEPRRRARFPIFVYAVERPAPFADLGDDGRARIVEARPGGLRLELEAARAGELVVRERNAPGWSAVLDGRPAELLAGRRHLALRVPAGAHSLTLRYRAPGLRAGLALSLAALATVVGLALWRRRAADGRV